MLGGKSPEECLKLHPRRSIQKLKTLDIFVAMQVGRSAIDQPESAPEPIIDHLLLE